MRVESISLAEAQPADLLPTLAWRDHQDGRGEDRTVFSVDLPQPVPPGGTAVVDLAWEAKIPRVRRRTGYKDDFLLMAHWFPKLGVYEEGAGWKTHQFHLNTEFYADYGTYTVELDLPAEYEDHVGGSGKIVLDDERADRVTVRFEAPSEVDRAYVDRTGSSPLVHAFTWTGDPDFVVHEYRFLYADWAAEFPHEVERAQAALGPDVDLTLRDVDVIVLIQREREEQAERHFRATSAALFFYGEYPYERVTVVDPAWGAGGAGGMEYPTLFTAGTSLFTWPEMHRPESVTVHEAGHQFWYGLVGNNEPEAAWLDEGFNSYTDSEVLWRTYGAQHDSTSYARWPLDGAHLAAAPGTEGLAGWLTLAGLTLPGGYTPRPLRRGGAGQRGRGGGGGGGMLQAWFEQPLLTLGTRTSDPRWRDRSGYLRSPEVDPIDMPAWNYVDAVSYRTNSYPRTAVMLRTLRGLVGHDDFLRGMRRYAEEWRYRHPYPDDFFDAFVEGSGRDDVRWFLEAAFRGTGTVDWSVDVEQGNEPEPAGWFLDDEGHWVLLEEPEADDVPSEPIDTAQGDPDEDAQLDARAWVAKVTLRRRGELALDLPVRITFQDGAVEDLVWTREDQLAQRWVRIERDRKLASVVLDPPTLEHGTAKEGDHGRRYWIDTDMSNNAWHAEVDDVTPLRWTERVFTRYAHLLHRLGGVGG
jgi:hypothetical protein